MTRQFMKCMECLCVLIGCIVAAAILMLAIVGALNIQYAYEEAQYYEARASHWYADPLWCKFNPDECVKL